MIRFLESDYALILGASSGFGAATALSLARAGCNIIGVHLDRAAGMKQVEELQSEIASHGVSATFFNTNAADAGKRNEVIEAMTELSPDHGNPPRIRLLLHSLAFGTLRPLISREDSMITEAQLAMTQNVMASSLVFWTQDLYRKGLLSSGSRVLALTSSGSHSVLPNYGAVSGAKAALESYCRQLAFELGPDKITVNAIEAGVTDTAALRKIPGDGAIREHALDRNPGGRLTRPEDVAGMIRLLCSEDAGWVNGSTIRVDGGEGVVELDWREDQR